MSNDPRSTDTPYGQKHQPQRRSENGLGNVELPQDDDIDSDDAGQLQDDAPIDDPGDAQRSSKSEQDGDGEETLG